MNGKQAIDALLSPTQDVDLILTDIMMPEVDGMELMKIVQESDKPFRSIPIIIMSTVDSDEFKTKCGDAGATDYLVKPVRKQQMEALSRHASIGLNSSASTAAGASVGASGAEHTGAQGSRARRGLGPEPEERRLEHLRGHRAGRARRLAGGAQLGAGGGGARPREALEPRRQPKGAARARGGGTRGGGDGQGAGGEGQARR